MRATITRTAVFSIGVLAFWLAYLLRANVASHGGTISGAAVLRVSVWAAGLTALSGLGAFLALAGARRAVTSVPVWGMAPAGVALGLLTEPAMDVLAAYGIPVRQTLLCPLLATGAVAAIFTWLGVQIVHSLRGRWPEISSEFDRINSMGAEKVAFWLAVMVWFFGLVQLLGVPGFG